MIDNKVYLTIEGVQELERELDYLKNVRRHEVIQELQEARAQGDLSENAEYDAARDAQAYVEGRIKKIENMLENVEIISENASGRVEVSLGSTVVVKDADLDEQIEYKIVGSTEVSPAEGKISNESPIAVAILGKKVGDKVTVEAPDFSYEVEILEIK